MKAVIVSLLIAFAIASTHPVNREIVQEILNAKTTWTPMEPEANPFAYMSIEQIKGMLGTRINPANEGRINMNIVSDQDSFDARAQWPDFVHSIMNQGQCGSCWAFGATEALSDRFAIASNGQINVVLSPQYLVSCDDGNMGCNGGWLDEAWKFMQNHGLPSQDCVSYKSGGGSTGQCPSTCDDGSEMQLYRCGDVQETQSVADIQNAIMTNGPVEAAFTVYEDFFSYAGGIYRHTSGGVAGGHAIKAVGWGVEGDTRYWIMANSWGTGWGENGFFRIAFGECGIESDVTFAPAIVSQAVSE
uniref:Peptidase C1A papain C-terminal domain-containing protein n=1 Tax=Euplotes harpa TaxID=151035 RepID=A0A7S3NH55_9SPIT|mmetsp:Transcript_63/g.66  ORF Transcript_63/g.66 Transcript_63/m.66 type:complete len:302 (+) Transcript_63:35-940(+)